MTDFVVSDAQWDALGLVIERADGSQTTHLVRGTPHGDAAITVRTANALEARGFITITGTTAWPTKGGRRAYSTHQRLVSRQPQEQP